MVLHNRIWYYISVLEHTTTEPAYNPISPTKYSSYYNIFFKTAAIFFSNIIAVLLLHGGAFSAGFSLRMRMSST